LADRTRAAGTAGAANRFPFRSAVMPSTVPNLTTAQTAPLLHFEKRLLERATDIETWFRGQWLKTPAPFYCSVDLRNAGFKLAPVDTNLFPAGFNNLNPAFEALCVQALQAAMERHCASAARVLLIPESHTRNLFYLENVATLRNLLVEAGYAVRIGSLAVENDRSGSTCSPASSWCWRS
jgi:Glutamate-cysteine ligase.